MCVYTMHGHDTVSFKANTYWLAYLNVYQHMAYCKIAFHQCSL